ncbi:hypothetical protein WEI85_01600 [Actinomycetes bacterium KLBMP 9797]
MTRSEMMRLRRQMQRRIREVVAERRMTVNQLPPPAEATPAPEPDKR